jgi:acyl-CoA synthetase (AMP-forming)/AMP-acid ligase II
VPVFGMTARILDDDGAEAPVGQIGEIVVSGPQVIPGYWERPEESAAALPDGELRTGDVGFMGADGWFYLVDRKKDMINASGYKIWPREVEDLLYSHPAVREVAVIGVPDPERGETVKAFVSLKAGTAVTPEELIAYGRETMAAYKYPRMVEIIDELPKTTTGKILRRELRDRPSPESSRQGRTNRLGPGVIASVDRDPVDFSPLAARRLRATPFSGVSGHVTYAIDRIASLSPTPSTSSIGVDGVADRRRLGSVA